MLVFLCGAAATAASGITFALIARHLANYRKPRLQRLTLRIISIIPLFCLACFLELVGSRLTLATTPLREIYEAFVIYTFFSLLTTTLGGERAISTFSLGRLPIAHPFPLGMVLPPVDILDPYTFLNLKRGILQYVWLKPVLICGSHTTGTAASLVFLLYNILVLLSLYNLGMFWACLYDDLRPFLPMAKFLCVKMLIFASYWQGVLIGLGLWLGFVPLPEAGTRIQNALLCVELVPMAIAHWRAFGVDPFSTQQLPCTARMTVLAAIRDVCGVQDLAHDFITTFQGGGYDYRSFELHAAGLPDEESRRRRIAQGLRYGTNGERYWIREDRREDPEAWEKDDVTEAVFREVQRGWQGDPNYPVVEDHTSYVWSDGIQRERERVRGMYDAVGTQYGATLEAEP